MPGFVHRQLLRLDPETAHNIVIRAWSVGQSIPPILEVIRAVHHLAVSEDTVELLGMRFPYRVGLAAGFDKGARVLPMLQAFGFGHVEVGTVTPLPQPGNPRPRIFRFTTRRAIVNRMGFNSEGARVVKKRLASHRPDISIPIGVSLGKNKDTPLPLAADDYTSVLVMLYDYGDYFVINVSSPNTPDLRLLQTPEYLGNLVRSVVRKVEFEAWGREKPPKPVLVKFDPDSTLCDLREMVSVAVDNGAQGVILTNTTTNFPRRIRELHERLNGAGGGLSGAPLHNKVLDRVEFIRRHFPNLVIIGVGGVMDVTSYRAMIDAGADLIQIYTGFIYHGLPLLRDLRKEYIPSKQPEAVFA